MTTDHHATPPQAAAPPDRAVRAVPDGADVPKPRAADPSQAVETSETSEIGSIETASVDTSGSDTSSSDTTAVARPAGSARRVLVRLHFYAGVLVAPFLVVAALTGLAYTVTPQLDRIVYGDQLFVAVPPPGTQPRPLSEQVAAARAVHPEGTLSTVLTPAAPNRSTEVVLDVDGLGTDRQRTVYVDPYTAQVTGELTTWWGSTPLTTWLDDLHRNLHLGAVGRYYSELAASWLWVVALGGLWLWAARRRRNRRVRRVLAPDLAARGRRRTMAWHGSVGVWLVVGLLFLSATGLTWSRHAGGHFTAALDRFQAHAPELDTALPAAATATATAAAAAAESESEAPHQGAGDHGGVTPAEEQPSGERGLIGDIDGVLAGARAAGLDGPVEVGLPADDASAWTVAQTDRTWPVRQSKAAIDPADGSVVSFAAWSEFPLPAKLSRLGVAGHMGLLFGLANQILLAALAVGLLCVVVWGYRMWWQRRPVRAGRHAPLGPPPGRGASRELRRPAVAVCLLVVVGVGWALPVLGVTLVGFLILDATLGAVGRRRERRRPSHRHA